MSPHTDQTEKKGGRGGEGYINSDFTRRKQREKTSHTQRRGNTFTTQGHCAYSHLSEIELHVAVCAHVLNGGTHVLVVRSILKIDVEISLKCIAHKHMTNADGLWLGRWHSLCSLNKR